jgi:TRAP-type mannitol/chloroaromatic compound transport system permease small subunit
MTDAQYVKARRSSVLVTILRFLEGINKVVGDVVCWLALGAALVCFAVVVLRYAFGIGIIWLQELYVWQHALLFMLGAGPAYLRNEHVSVDLFTENRSPKTRAILTLLGLVFLLLPFLGLVAMTSWSFASVSWRIGETSGQMGGLPGIYVMKFSLLVFVFLLAVQGVASAIRNILILGNDPEILLEQTTSEASEC